MRTLLLSAVLLAPAAIEAQSARQRQYLSLGEATLRNPVTPIELRDAALSPDGVALVRALFERSIEESLVLDGRVVTPELGGEATLDEGTLALHPYPDPIHPLVREMARLKAEPARLLAALESSPDGRRLLSTTGGLHALLFVMSSNPPTAEQEKLLANVVASAVATHFKTWTVDPETQARAIETIDWRGRYVGFWHLHPPRVQSGGELGEGIEPSVEDMRNAAELGQFLTIVFQPDGFDLYDLSPLAGSTSPNLSRLRRYPFRSPEWNGRFRKAVADRLHVSN